jgi:hypothetical protein
VDDLLAVSAEIADAWGVDDNDALQEELETCAIIRAETADLPKGFSGKLAKDLRKASRLAGDLQKLLSGSPLLLAVLRQRKVSTDLSSVQLATGTLAHIYEEIKKEKAQKSPHRSAYKDQADLLFIGNLLISYQRLTGKTPERSWYNEDYGEDFTLGVAKALEAIYGPDDVMGATTVRDYVLRILDRRLSKLKTE